ncbi:MAG: phosphatidylserine decarboxylase [Holosporales bacterium]|jgi:phosphatidylserine decarboxylase|nr:phosphatidylserine decarboxylase [Holosporales bacterium]
MFCRLPKYKLHRDGIGFSLSFAVASYLIGRANLTLGYLSSLSVIWCIYFFRVPCRTSPVGKGLIVSAADGHVVSIKEVLPPPEFCLGASPRMRVSVFLNIFDVHVNYIPISGKITHVYYKQGHFFNAAKDKASEHNEKNALVIQLDEQKDCSIGVVQIAGLVARRIRCDVRCGDIVKRGQYYGLIRFGSRQDIYLPENARVTVKVGEKVFAATTVLAELVPLQEESVVQEKTTNAEGTNA